MKKASKLIFLIAVVVALFAMTMLISSAVFDDTPLDGTTYYYQVADDTGYVWGYATTLADAVINAEAGDTITVLGNVSESSPVSISVGVTLDGNGYTITATSAIDKDTFFLTFNSGSSRLLNIKLIAEACKPISVKGGAQLDVGAEGADNSGIYIQMGAVTGFVIEEENTRCTVWGGTIQSSPTSNTATLRVGTAGTTSKPHLQINGGNIYALTNSGTGYSVFATGNSTLTVTDGHFAFTKSQPDITKAAGTDVKGYSASVYVVTGNWVQLLGGTYWNGNNNAAITAADKGTHNMVIGDVTVYGFRCIWIRSGLEAAPSNIYITGGTYSPTPGQANSKLLDVYGANVNVYVFDGTFNASATTAGNAGTNGGAIHMGQDSDNDTTKLYIYGGTFINNSTTANSSVLNYNESKNDSGKYANEGAGVVYIGTGSQTVTVRGQSQTFTGTGATFSANGGCKIFRFPNVKSNADPNRKCTLTIDEGTFTVEGSQLSSLNESATITINGGSFNITGGNLFSITRLNTSLSLPTVTIAGGTFNVAGGAVIADGQLTGGHYEEGRNIGGSWMNVGVSGAVINLGAGAIMPSDIELWKDTTFNISGGGSVIVGADKTLTFASAEEALTIAVADAEKSLAAAYANGTYVKTGKNVYIKITEVPIFTVEGGTLNITGGVYSMKATFVTLKSGTVNVTGGSFTRENAGRIFSIEGGSFNISGESTTLVGENFGANSGFIYISDGSLTVSDASFRLTNGGTIISLVGGEVTVNSGTFFKDNDKSAYYEGSVFYFGESGVTPSLTVNGGTFTASSMVRIYTKRTSSDEEGATATINGGTFIDNARSDIHTDNKYLFQVARLGRNIINIKGDITVTATPYTCFFNANASAGGAVFNIHGGTYEGGRAWIMNSRENTVISIKNATFKDTTGTMIGATSATLVAFYNSIDEACTITIDNSSFYLNTPTIDFLQSDGQATLAATNSTFVVTSLIREDDTYSAGMSFTDCSIVITDSDNIVFPYISTKLERTVVMAPKGTTVFREEILTAYAPDATYGGVTYKAWTKSAATSENAPVLGTGAGLLVDTAAKETSGLRFDTTIPATVIASLTADYAGATFKYYTLIAPADYVAEAGVFTKEALDLLGYEIPYVSILAEKSLKIGNGVSYNGALINLKSNTRAYAAVPYIEVVAGDGAVIDTIYGAYNSFDNARTAEQVADDIIFAKNEYAEMTAEQQAIVDAYSNGVASLFEGKRILVVGNSLTYYGGCVLHKSQSYLSQASREGDHGFLFQLGLSNDIVFSVTNWTFGGHTIGDLFLGNCVADRGCDGKDHLSYITDRDYDYVVIQQGNASREIDMSQVVKYVKEAFEPTNPNVQIVVLGTTSHYRTDYTSNALIVPYFAKAERESGIIVADWGRLARDLMEGRVFVENSQFDYNKNSFIVNWDGGKDGYHPNMLSGYLTATFLYCVITGEEAYGQAYEFCQTTLVNGGLDIAAFRKKFYTYDNPDTDVNEKLTNFGEILASESEIRGIQKLIDQYIAEKAYRNDAVQE